MRAAALVVFALTALLVPAGSLSAAQSPDWMPEALPELEAKLVAEYGEQQQERIHRGLHQVADFWRSERWRPGRVRGLRAH